MPRWLPMIALLMLSAPLRAEEAGALFNAEGYRIAHYRAPVVSGDPNVRRIALTAAAHLRPDRDAIFIDVLPAEGGHREVDGTWRLAVPRETIPGAHWFPETGRGALSTEIAQWFERGVTRLARHRHDRMIVAFCLADCWMSWNAVKRLRTLGYTNVWWLAEGTDGWRDLGLRLESVTPER